IKVGKVPKFLSNKKMTVSSDNIPFFKLLFEEGVYRARKNKYTTGDAIVPVKSVHEESVSYTPKAIRFSGITSKTLLLFNYPDESSIPLEDNLFLSQVLKAAGLSFENVSRLYLGSPRQNISWTDIAAQSGSDFVIAFGIDQACLPD